MQAASFVKKLSLLSLLLSILLCAVLFSQVRATSLVLDYNSSYALPGPVTIGATIFSTQPFNGTIKPTNLQNFLSLSPVTFTESSFVVNDSNSVKSTISLILSASDIGSFTTNLVVTNDTLDGPQTLTSSSIESSFYYDAPPQVISAKLIPNTTNASTIFVQFETDIGSDCKFDFVPTTYDQAVFSLYLSSQSNTLHTYALTDAKQKEYSFYVVCKALSSQKTMSSPYVYIFNITKNPPIVISHQPDIVNGGTGMQLSVQTDVSSLCKYDKSDVSYDSMGTFFDYIYGTTHQALIPLVNDAIKLYVRCVDKVNNVMQSSYIVNYAKQSAPSANLEVSDYISGNYLTDGLHTITLTTTPQLANPPSLFVSYITDGGVKTVKIPLALYSTNTLNSSQIYKGSLQILPNEFSGVAYFDFEGIDLLGNHGTQITGETSIIVLAKSPNPVQTVVAVQQYAQTNDSADVAVDVSWVDTPDPYFDHYEIQKYYASDLITKISSKNTVSAQTIDRDLITGKTYVYGIVSVNKALKGSTPTFSAPITVTQVSSSVLTSPSSQSNQVPRVTGSSYSMPQYLSANLAAIQERLDKLVTEFKAAESSPLFSFIGATTTNAKIISHLDSTITESRKKVFSNNQEVSDYITFLLNEETDAKQQFISNVHIIESQSQKQTISKDEYAALFGEYLAAKRWDGNAKDFDFVLSATEDLMSKLTITQHQSLMGVTYYNGAQDVRTYLSKDIVGPIPQQSQLFEFMGDKTSQALWDNGDYQRLVKFMVTSNVDNISYYFTGSIPKEQTATFKTIYFPQNPFDTPQSTTGNFFATNFSLGSVLYYVLGFIAILCLGVYYRTGSAASLLDIASLSWLQKSTHNVMTFPKKIFSKKSLEVSDAQVGLFKDVNAQINTPAEAHMTAVGTKPDAQTILDSVTKNDSALQSKNNFGESVNSQNSQTRSQQSPSQSSKHSLSDVVIDPKELISFRSKSVSSRQIDASQQDLIEDELKNATIVKRQINPTNQIAQTNTSTSPAHIRTYNLAEELYEAEKRLTNISTKNEIFQKIPQAIKEYRAPQNLCFITRDGKKISTLLELAFALSQMTDEVFSYHVNDSKHDFAIWIKDIFGLSKHAWVLKEIKERHALAQAIFMLVEGEMLTQEQYENE